MQCPIDHTVLSAINVSPRITLEYCKTCGGVWIDQEELKHLGTHFEIGDATERLQNLEEILSHEHTPQDRLSQRVIECPRGHGPIPHHREYAANSGIRIDQCAFCHGFWFDGGELAAVQAYVEHDPKGDFAQLLVELNTTTKHEEAYEQAKLTLPILPLLLFFYPHLAAQAIYQLLREWQFSESNKAKDQARREGQIEY